MLNTNIIGAHNQVDALSQIIGVLQQEMEKPETTNEEKAFYLGHINLASALIDAATSTKGNMVIGKLCFDYDIIKDAYKKSFEKPVFRKLKDIIKKLSPEELAEILEKEFEDKLKDNED